MKWNPFYNAIGAVVYIVLVALFLRFIESIRHDTPDTLLDGIAILSLLVLSVATMAFLFFYYPITKLIEDKRVEALTYFLQTLGWFGLLTVGILTVVSLQ